MRTVFPLGGALAVLVAAHPAHTAPGAPAACTFTIIATASDTCASLAATWLLSVDQFVAYNPSVGVDCQAGIVAGQAYCVEHDYGADEPEPEPEPEPTSTTTGTGTGTDTSTQTTYTATTLPATLTSSTTTTAPMLASTTDNTTTTTKSTKSTTRSTTTITTTVAITATAPETPSPTYVQAGIAPNCNAFYHVVRDDTCAKIVAAYGTFSLADFYSWNPAVGTDCTNLQTDSYVCVGIPGTPTTPTPALPSPTQPGLTDKCTQFYLVVKDDTCAKLVEKFGTFSLADFYAWNPAVGTDCTNLWTDTYVCVGVTKTRRRL